ncbi:putative early light-induced protein, chloroplastic-like [Capsicum annuum]|nr:putative early light-induced protein, chloroplastic-like [Capsicum annuum]
MDLASTQARTYPEVRDLFSFHDVQYILKDCSLNSLRNDPVTKALDLYYPMYNPQQKVCVVGSVNGLICLSIKDLVLWNPSMRLFRHLADSGLRVSGDCSVVYGFGYDDYKVVGVLFMHGFLILEDHVVVKICSLKSNSWSSMDDIPVVVRLTKPFKFVNGKLHWAGVLSWSNNIYGGFHKDWNIVSIDLADEKPGEVEQPRYGEGGFCLNLEVLGSDLSVLCNCIKNYIESYMWVMREYGVKESWTKMYTIKNRGDVISLFFPQILCISNKGDILLVPGSTMMVRNPEVEPIRYPKVTNFGSCNAVNIYIESLVCATPFWNAQSKNKGC